MISQITSKENQNIKNFIRYSNEKKIRNRDGVFTLEGMNLITEAFEENVNVKSVFLSTSFMEKHSGTVSFLLEKNTLLYEIPDEIGKRMSQTQMPQGIFAIAKKVDKPLFLDTIYNEGKYLALYDVADPGNLGTIIRTADALGMNGIILSKDCCDLYSPKVIRSTMGSLFRVPLLHVNDFSALLSDLNQNSVFTVASSVHKNAVALNTYSFSNPAVLFIGNEARGLPEEIADHCVNRLTIPMGERTESLNVAMAAGILMWEMCKNT